MSCFYLALLYYLISFHSVVVFVVTSTILVISLWVVVLTNNLKFAVYQIVAGWIPI